jgi:hypothetical protein
MFKKIFIIYPFVLLKTFSLFSQDNEFPFGLGKILEIYHESNPDCKGSPVFDFLPKLKEFLTKDNPSIYLTQIPESRSISAEEKISRENIVSNFFIDFKDNLNSPQDSVCPHSWNVINFLSRLDVESRLFLYKECCKKPELSENLDEEIVKFLDFANGSFVPKNLDDRLWRTSVLTRSFVHSFNRKMHYHQNRSYGVLPELLKAAEHVRSGVLPEVSRAGQSSTSVPFEDCFSYFYRYPRYTSSSTECIILIGLQAVLEQKEHKEFIEALYLKLLPTGKKGKKRSESLMKLCPNFAEIIIEELEYVFQKPLGQFTTQELFDFMNKRVFSSKNEF